MQRGGGEGAPDVVPLAADPSPVLKAAIEAHPKKDTITKPAGAVNYLRNIRRITDISDADIALFCAISLDDQLVVLGGWYHLLLSDDVFRLFKRLYVLSELSDRVKIDIVELVIKKFVLHVCELSKEATAWVMDKLKEISDKSSFNSSLIEALSNTHLRIASVLVGLGHDPGCVEIFEE